VGDPAGSAIAANAEIMSEGNGFHRSFQISSDGHALLQDLPFGICRLRGLHPRGSAYGMQFSLDGQPLMQNRSPGFAPDSDSDDVESMRVLTAGFPRNTSVVI
jgi:hypothetical protein